MADFKTAHQFVERWEGGYSRHPSDRGGETYLGISRKAHPTWEGWAFLEQGDKAIARDKAEQLYRTEYWEPIQGDKYDSQRLATIVYQCAVNVGVRRAIRWLQEVLLSHSKGWIAVDGIMGPKTLHKLTQCDDFVVGEEFLDKQEEHYMAIAASDISQRVFLNGWRNRVMAARALA